MADCSKVLVFISEFKRLCGCKKCSECPLAGNCHLNIKYVTQKQIDILQKWSDENPQETMLEHFKKLLPNAKLNELGVPDICPEELGFCAEVENCRGYDDCESCWSRPYENL